MSERHNRAVVAYQLKSVAERNSLSFVALDDDDLREREPLYRAATGDDAYYQLLLADMLFERSSAGAASGRPADLADDLA